MVKERAKYIFESASVHYFYASAYARGKGKKLCVHDREGESRASLLCERTREKEREKALICEHMLAREREEKKRKHLYEAMLTPSLSLSCVY